MRIEVETDDFSTDQPLWHFAACCAGFELGTCRSQVESVVVRPRRVSDPRGGDAIRCQVEVGLIGRDRLLVDVVDSDLHLAIYYALERAGLHVTRRLQQELHDTGDLAMIERHPIDRRAAEQAA